MSTVQLDPPWRQAVEDANQQFLYGDTIPKQWLMNAFCIMPARTIKDVDRERLEWLKAMTEFREHLSELHKKELRPVPGVGYMVLEPRDQTTYAREEATRSMRSLVRKWERRLYNVNMNLLTIDERKRNADQCGRLAALRAFSRKKLRG